MPGKIAKASLLALAVIVVAASAQAQTARQPIARQKQQRSTEPAALPADGRDSVVAPPGAFAGRPYWFALAHCGGVYFKLNALYTDAAVHARVVKPDPTANSEYTRKLNEAIKVATAYLDGAEHFLMTERKIERSDAVLTYDAQMRAAGEKLKSIDAGLAAAKTCPALYQSCRESHPKLCSEPLIPVR